MHHSYREVLLRRWAALTCGRPKTLLALALVLTGISIAVTLSHLRFEPDRNALISDQLDWHARYLRYLKDFEGFDRILVVAKAPASDSGRERAQAFVESIAKQLMLEGSPFREVQWGFDPKTVSPALIRLEPMPSFETALDQLRQSKDLLSAESLTDLAKAGAALAPKEPWIYLTSDDGQLFFIQAQPKPALDHVDPFEPAVLAARQALEATRKQFPEIESGLTGIPVMESDETNSSTADATRCSLIAAVVLAGLMALAFGGIRLPMLTVITLGFGIAWTFGFLTLAIGHLQMLSLFFTAMLLGLGIDFGIHLVSRYELIRHDHPDDPCGCDNAIADAMQSTGPGIVTGAVTTAIAFGTTLFTDYKGMAEMGLIAGVGILLCLAAMFWVLPVLLRLFYHRQKHVIPVHERPLDLHRLYWLMPAAKSPVATLVVTGIALTLCAIAGLGVRFDHNLMNLYPKGLESLHWQDEIQKHSSRAIWFGVSLANNLDEARQRTEAFRKLDSVAAIGGIGELFPTDEAQKLQALRDARLALGEDLLTPPTPEQVAEASGTQRLLLNAQSEARRKISDALSDRALTPDDLPAALRHEAVSKNGRQFQIQVYPKNDVWDPAQMAPFVAELRSIDPEITGSPVQIYESGLLMERSYIQAGVYALLACLALVWLDFRRLRDACTAMLPVFMGFIGLFGLMRLLGEPINPANIIVLPLMFGIGVDAGVHMLHRYKLDPRARPLGLSAGTGKGILLTAVTTVIGFASLMMASHRGVRSLGLVLAMGVGLTAMACLLVMPAILELCNRRRSAIARTTRQASTGDQTVD